MASRTAIETRAVEDVSVQLVALVRGLRELHVAIVDAGGHHVEASALGLLARLDELGATRLSTLAAGMCLDLSTVSRQVPALEREGWVDRTRDPQDHRAQRLQLTDAGRDMLETIRRSRAEVLTRLLPDWSEPELRDFADQLTRFNRDVTATTAKERA